MLLKIKRLKGLIVERLKYKVAEWSRSLYCKIEVEKLKGLFKKFVIPVQAGIYLKVCYGFLFSQK